MDGCGQLGGELALLLDALEDGLAPGLEFTQVSEALLEGAQLRIVETLRGLLAVTRDEGNRGALVEQADGRLDLLHAHAELFGDLPVDLIHGFL